MLDTPANRALVNRGIAEKDVRATITDDGIVKRANSIYATSIDSIFWPTCDYTRDLNACHDVCEERGWKIQSTWMYYDDGDMYSVSVIHPQARFWNAFTGTDLRWLVAMAVWEAVKQC